MVREAHGLEQLMAIVKDKNMRDNKPLLAAATGALWKCTLVEENVKHLDNVSDAYLLSNLHEAVNPLKCFPFSFES